MAGDPLKLDATSELRDLTAQASKVFDQINIWLVKNQRYGYLPDAPNTPPIDPKEWNALDYGTTLDAGEGENAGIVRADVGAVVFGTADALRTVLNSGHATNMAKLL